MSKKNKRKRQQERLLSLQNNSNNKHSSLNNNNTNNNEINNNDNRKKEALIISKEQQQRQQQQSKSLESSNNNSNNNTFFTAASRKRSLPIVSFVYPKQKDRKTTPFVFGESNNNNNNNKTLQQQNGETTTTTINNNNNYNNDNNNNTKSQKRPNDVQTIDDILYPTKLKKVFVLANNASVQTNNNNNNVQSESTIERNDNDNNNNNKRQRSLSQEEKKRQQQQQQVSLSETASLQEEKGEEGFLSSSSYLSNVEDAVRDKVGLRPRSNSTDGELNLPQRGLCDERKVLENYKWRLKNIISKASLPKGLNNLGNTCFLNSTIQCLAYCPPFSQSLIEMPEIINNGIISQKYCHNNYNNHNNNKKKKVNNQGRNITQMMADLLRQIHSTTANNNNNNNMNYNGSKSSISPRNIVTAVPTLGTICSGGSRNGYKFRPGRQEDAHEFLVHVLDAMHDGELYEAGISVRKSGWRINLPVPRLDETTFIHRIFGGYLRSQVQCTICKYRSNTYDPFLDLSLEISNKNCYTLANAFHEYTRKETLDTANKWKCSGCNKRVCATKQLTIFRPPLVLCIQLKRFAYNGYNQSNGYNMNGGYGIFGRMNGGGGGGKKISKPIDFPANLKLPLSDGRSCPYSLTGVVMHIGNSPSSGHYTACIKKPIITGDGEENNNNNNYKWYLMDDSYVKPISEQQVLHQKDAYVLLYCRKEVKLEYPQPPLSSNMTAKEATEYGRAKARARADSFNNESVLVSSTNNNNNNEINNINKSSPKQPVSDNDDNDDQNNIRTNSVRQENNKIDAILKMKANEDYEVEERKKEVVKESKVNSISHNDKKLTQIVKTNSNTDKPEKSLSQNTENEKMNFIGPLPKDDDSSENSSDSSNDSSSDVDSSSSSSSSSDDSDSSSSSEDDEMDEKSGQNKSHEANKNKLEDKATIISKSINSESPDSSQKAVEQQKKLKQQRDNVTRVKIDRGTSGKVEVMMGPRYKTKNKSWTPKSSSYDGGGQKDDSSFHLLGNLRISKWDDDDNNENNDTGTPIAAADNRRNDRSQIAKNVEKEEMKRKRKMHLDRYDSLLDVGKTKKVKKKKPETTPPVGLNHNAFQRIQASVQRMSRGRQKGHFRPPPSSKKKRRR